MLLLHTAATSITFVIHRYVGHAQTFTLPQLLITIGSDFTYCNALDEILIFVDIYLFLTYNVVSLWVDCMPT